MPQTRMRLAIDVAAQLNEVEQQLDVAIAAASALLAKMPQARIEAKVAASVGHEAMAGMGSVVAQLIAARTSIVGVHGDLSELSKDLQLPTIAGGDLWKFPPPSLLQVVANDRKAA